jgi:phage terminase small subunit
MRQRGRKSADELAVLSINGKGPRLEPPSFLPKAERSVFLDLVNSADLDHFRASDLPLLCRYAEAVVLAEQAAKHLRRGVVSQEGKVSAWIVVQEKAVRAMVALSMRLRLSPQSRIDAKTLARQPIRGHRAPWEWNPVDANARTKSATR